MLNIQEVKGVTVNYLKVLGMLDIEIFINGMVFVHSVHVIHYAFILGLDILRTNHATIDYATNTLNIDTKSNMHVCPIIADTGLSRAIDNVIIHKRSETTIRVKISRCVEGEEVLLEPVPALALKHIIAAKCIVTVHNHGAYLKVMNPTYNDINLTNNQVLATVQELSKGRVIPLEEESFTNINTVSMGTEKSECKSDLQFDFSDSDLTEIQKKIFRSF